MTDPATAEQRLAVQDPTYLGWHQVAFAREVASELKPITLGDRSLMLVRQPGGIATFDATCPHRGANLAFGGQVLEGAITCPFHGKRICLGHDSRGAYQVRGYRTLEVAGLVFVLLSDHHENGFTSLMEKLAVTHDLFPGFILPVHVSPDYVIENVFDADHFRTVHKINTRPDLEVHQTPDGALRVQGTFFTNRPNTWQDGNGGGGLTETRFVAHVFSPTLVVTELGEADRPNVVITAASPTADGQSVVRVTVGVPAHPDGEGVTTDVVRALVQDSRLAFEQDVVVWEHLDPRVTPHYDGGDAAVMEFRRFCDRFSYDRAP